MSDRTQLFDAFKSGKISIVYHDEKPLCMWALPSNCWGSPQKVVAWTNPSEDDDTAGRDE
jgi:hypothetical protein